MKVSKVLMSAVLVLAMLLSMFACAEGDAFTLRNVKLNLAGEEIVIGPAAFSPAMMRTMALQSCISNCRMVKTFIFP